MDASLMHSLYALAASSPTEYALLQKVDVSTVKNILRFAEGKVWKQVDYTRAEMLKYLENKMAVGEGNEWLHADSAKWKAVKAEAYDECSSFYSCLNNCVAVLFMEQEDKARIRECPDAE